ncbi:hypothetical protein CANCADRAFT_32066 [Tortispora caseinolytica NRRL Y-17796]|uniref:FAD dependent oxidoreductase domain-containing protein n=1 Tax=Tortispora caseinolytica NRRL Y-17796 TaxID=767744 RepID=A0A1E4TI41_9ASCO|nr:hypothetical protein CANCADRAFT_32066 [Tortispora caseinolytica NRRL Y-17796]
MAKVVVVGAGVIGLSTALALAEQGHDVAIIGAFLPGDQHIEYTSPWAGANWMSFALNQPDVEKYDGETYKYFYKLAESVPQAGITFRNNVIITRKSDADLPDKQLGSLFLKRGPWFKNLVKNYTPLTASELRSYPGEMAYGYKFLSFNINPSVYLAWLVSQLSNFGIRLKRVKLAHINDAVKYHPKGTPDYVVNCTGVMVSTLGGINDPNAIPIRGQIVLVRDPCPNRFGLDTMLSISGVDGSPWVQSETRQELFYSMSRGDGTTVLGGCFVAGDYTDSVDPRLADRIVARAKQYLPELLNEQGEFEIIRHVVGWRPGRVGGPRLEIESAPLPGTNVKVVHNYGAGGGGYQGSRGMAVTVAHIIENDIASKKSLKGSSKL